MMYGHVTVQAATPSWCISTSCCVCFCCPLLVMHGLELICSCFRYLECQCLPSCLPTCSQIHFSGDARYLWTHGTRLGVLPPVQEGADSLQGNPQAGSSGTSGRGSRQGQGTGRAERAKLCDWWGSREHLVPRGLERTSIVLAFGPAEELAGSGSTGKPG